MWLRVLSGEDAGRTVELPEAGRPFVLGRVQGCDLVIRDERASRQHAELRAEPGGGVRVRDLGSANGTYVDDRRVDEALLAGGEELRIAGVEIAVLARRPASEGGEAAAPTWSGVGRLVDRRTRGARRATRAALAATALALVAVVVVLLVGGGGDDDRVPEVVRELSPATVLVEALRGERRTATGSGWVLDAGAGLVVTTAHVINEGVRYRVVVGGQAQPAKLVAAAPCEDLALLRVRGLSGLRSAPLGTGADLEQGETVVALGYPASAAPNDAVTSTRGVVSAPRAAFRDPSARRAGLSRGGPDRHRAEPRATPAARWPTSTAASSASTRRRAPTGSDGRPLEGQNFAIGIDRARRVLAAAAPRPARSRGRARRSATRRRTSSSSASSRPAST